MAVPTLAASQSVTNATGALVQVDRIFTVTGPAPGVPFNNPTAIVLDANHGELLLANGGEHRIEIYDLQGTRLAHLFHRVVGPGGAIMDGTPLALALDRAGNLLVSDLFAAYVEALDYRGRTVRRLAWTPNGDAIAIGGPGAIAVADDGVILVASRGKQGRVAEYAPDFTKIGEWGVGGSEPGRLSAITGMAFTPGGNLAITCVNTEMAVQVFTPTGQFLHGFGKHDQGPGNFSFPSGVTVTQDGRIWVSDEIRLSVQVFDSNGVFMGMTAEAGRAPLEFNYPSALATDGNRLLAVAERVGNRFQLLRIP